MSRSEFLVSMEEIRYTWETSLVDVYGIGINKLVIRGGHILYLYDVLYALDIQRNLFSIVIMLKLSFWFFLNRLVRACVLAPLIKVNLPTCDIAWQRKKN